MEGKPLEQKDAPFGYFVAGDATFDKLEFKQRWRELRKMKPLGLTRWSTKYTEDGIVRTAYVIEWFEPGPALTSRSIN